MLKMTFESKTAPISSSSMLPALQVSLVQLWIFRNKRRQQPIRVATSIWLKTLAATHLCEDLCLMDTTSKFSVCDKRKKSVMTVKKSRKSAKEENCMIGSNSLKWSHPAFKKPRKSNCFSTSMWTWLLQRPAESASTLAMTFARLPTTFAKPFLWASRCRIRWLSIYCNRCRDTIRRRRNRRWSSKKKLKVPESLCLNKTRQPSLDYPTWANLATV